jgi:hypothetical protein
MIVIFFLVSAKNLYAEISWQDSYYNPQPAEEDLTLPMPCGGAMVFRRINTPNSDGVLGDVAVTLGEEGNDQPYLNGLRRSYVSGAFSDGKDTSGSKGHYYMAKYELAEAQYAAVMEAECPASAPRRRAFFPATEHSKLEYEQFAQKYTLWLMRENPDALPTADETKGYLRLPSEEEWEYAARGGLAVEETLFRAPRPILAEGEQQSEFIAHGGSDSAGGKIQVIGTLRANPLGLHDMLGNAAEIVGTNFSMVRHGRLHGQVGGIVSRGGDARTPLDRITSASRIEVPPLDILSAEATRDRFTGTRLVIAGLAITSGAQTADLVAALGELSAVDSKMLTAQSEQDVLGIIDSLRTALAEPRARQQLAQIRDNVESARAERNTQRDRSIRLLMESGTLMCNQVVQRYLNAASLDVDIQMLQDAKREAIQNGLAAELEEIKEIEVEAESAMRAMENLLREETFDYTNLIEELADQYSAELLDKQAKIVAPEIDGRSARRKQCLQVLREHLRLRQAEGYSEVSRIDADLRGIALGLMDR